MRERIDERLARAEARMEVATSSVDSQMADLDLASIEDDSERLYEEYQRQLGIIPPEPAEKTMETVDDVSVAEAVEQLEEPEVEEQTE